MIVRALSISLTRALAFWYTVVFVLFSWTLPFALHNADRAIPIVVMLITFAGISIYHLVTGKRVVAWLVCALAMAGLLGYDGYAHQKESLAFCEEELLKVCTLSEDGSIDCPSTSIYDSFSHSCERVIRKDRGLSDD